MIVTTFTIFVNIEKKSIFEIGVKRVEREWKFVQQNKCSSNEMKPIIKKKIKDVF